VRISDASGNEAVLCPNPTAGRIHYDPTMHIADGRLSMTSCWHPWFSLLEICIRKKHATLALMFQRFATLVE